MDLTLNHWGPRRLTNAFQGRTQVMPINFDRSAVQHGLISSIANDPESKIKLSGDDERDRDDTIDLLRESITDQNMHFSSAWGDVYFGNGSEKIYGHVFVDVPGQKKSRFDFTYSNKR